MPLDMKVGLGPYHIVLDGDPAPPPKGAQHSSPLFSAHVYCQTVAHLSILLSSGWDMRAYTDKQTYRHSCHNISPSPTGVK